MPAYGQESREHQALPPAQAALKSPGPAWAEDRALAAEDAGRRFPVRIEHIPGRGRGFFATRDIGRGETVFCAAPLAWSVSEDWARHTCWWCFAHDSRRALPVKAAPRQASPRSAQYRGVFCSAGCMDEAVGAHGGPERWAVYLELLGHIEADLTAHKASAGRLPSTGSRAPPAADGQPAHGARHLVGTSDVDTATFLADAGAEPLAEFDPCEASDEQLAAWISRVWDTIAQSGLFSAHMPDNSQRELVRLIACELFIHDGAGPTQTCRADAPPDWMGCMVLRCASEGPVAPAAALEHVRCNEVEYVRAMLRPDRAGPLADVADAPTPATLVPLRIPQRPLAAQIEGSWWGRAFRVAAASYALLDRAWGRTAGLRPAGRLPHQRFRGVYFREMANSFGIYDPPIALSALLQDSDNGLHGEVEQEYLGTSMYPTAVYFNHSCSPNVAKTRVGRNMRFVAAADVRLGDELFISYGCISDPVAERRSRLREHFFFECTCSRCALELAVKE
ncbi:hypothetical protein H4R18_003542 [Coemansia javaensis]|uniref:SET domain-containing protein n=1 Tax=Coemansia javaensis TaxID=2761396 RepID=A0A9W8H6R7_9FUNG|nr:hypothetical protein H4R18_003542 [Coemansia javaensis]